MLGAYTWNGVCKDPSKKVSKVFANTTQLLKWTMITNKLLENEIARRSTSFKVKNIY